MAPQALHVSMSCTLYYLTVESLGALQRSFFHCAVRPPRRLPVPSQGVKLQGPLGGVTNFEVDSTLAL